MPRSKKQHEGQESPKYRWLSSIRSPYERVFAYHNKKVRYRGLNKVQFQLDIRALVFNLKRLMGAGYRVYYIATGIEYRMSAFNLPVSEKMQAPCISGVSCT